jgi:hypothetical protein
MTETIQYIRVETLPPYLSIPQAAKIRNCNPSHIYTLLGRKRFRAVKDGRKLLIETQSFLDDMASLKQAEIKLPPSRAAAAAREHAGVDRQLQDRRSRRLHRARLSALDL